MKSDHWLNAAAICITALCAAAFADEPGKPQPASPLATNKPDKAEKRKVLVTISKETTYITEPLRPDGYVDYVKALNDRVSKGVTPENNASVLIWQALGPRKIDTWERAGFFKRLGITILPEEGDYFVPFETYIKSEPRVAAAAESANEAAIHDAKQMLAHPNQRPWRATDYPILAQWLKSNEKPLALIVAASKRPLRYDPLFSKSGVLFTAVIHPGSELFDISNALALRAMLSIGSGMTDSGMEDVFAIHRLARLLAQGPTAIESLVAFNLDRTAIEAEASILACVHLTPSEATRFRSRFLELSPFAPMAEKFGTCERYVFLDAVSTLAGGRRIDQGEVGKDESLKSALDALAASAESPKTINWDVSLRLGNESYDRLSEAFREPVRTKRRDEVKAIARGMRNMSIEVNNAVRSRDSANLATEPLRSQTMASLLITLLFPAVSLFNQLDDRAMMQRELTAVGFSLAAYRADHGKYPVKLDELKPKYAAEIPKDVFSDGELHYKTVGDGFVIYSVGPNGIDDDGKGLNDAKNDEPWDDIAFAVPGSSRAESKK